MHKNVKVSIEKIRVSTSLSDDYGTFSVVLRLLNDTDSNVQVLERFDNCNLNPASPNYVARKIGTAYAKWSDTDRRLRYYGDYPNQSKFVRVEMDETVDNGASDAKLLPFGYFGPPTFGQIGKTGTEWSGSIDGGGGGGVLTGRYIFTAGPLTASADTLLSGSDSMTGGTMAVSASAILTWPTDRLRHSASDGNGSDPTDSYFGFDNRRDASSTIADRSVMDIHRMLTADAGVNPGNSAGITGSAYVFTLDDVAKDRDWETKV